MQPDITLPKEPKVRKYIALITQENTNIPTATILQNTLGQTPTFTRQSVGVYWLTVATPIFWENKTHLLIGNTYADQARYSAVCYNSSGYTIEIRATNGAGVLSDDWMYNISLEIKLYQ